MSEDSQPKSSSSEPEVTPQAEPSPELVNSPSPKQRNKLKLLLLALTVVLLAGVVGWYMFIRDDKPVEQAATITDVKAIEVSGSLDQQKERITELVRAVSSNVADDFDFTKSSDEDYVGLVVEKEEAGRYVSLGEYGAAAKVENTRYNNETFSMNYETWLAAMKPVAAAIEGELVSGGFELVSDEPIDGATGFSYSRYQTDATICDVSYDTSAATLRCVPSAETEWAIEATQTFHDLLAATIEGNDWVTEVKADDAEKVGSQYERLGGGQGGVYIENGIPNRGGGASALFYREVGKNWQFFKVTQSISDCEEFNTVILQAVYADQECYIEGRDEIPTVKEFYAS